MSSDRRRLDDPPDVTPWLIVQRERDPFGTGDAVATDALPPSVRVPWSADGAHGLEPRNASGRTLDDHRDDPADAIAAFLDAVTRPA